MKAELGGIINEIRSAGYGRKGELVEKYSKILGVSVKTLYRMLAEASPTGRAKRCDAGESSLDESTLKLIAAMMLNSVRGNGKQTMDIRQQVAAEYEAMQRLLDTADDEVIDRLADKIIKIKEAQYEQ